MHKTIMRLLLILTILFIGCNSPSSPSSFWEDQKKNFAYRNKFEFRSDSALKTALPHLKEFSHPVFQKIKANKVFLYSWQERNPINNEFTVIKDNGEYGFSTYYFVLDKKDSLISFEKIAWREYEGNSWSEHNAKFSGQDTLFTYNLLAQEYDIETQKHFPPRQGSSRTYFVFEKNGKMDGRVEVWDVK